MIGWVMDDIDEKLEYGDSRSDRVNKLLRVGLAAEERASRMGMWPDDVEDQEELIIEALEHYHEHQLDNR